MFDELGKVVQNEHRKFKEQLKWFKKFNKYSRGINFLDDPFKEREFIHKIPDKVPKITKLSGVDGGVLSEAYMGFDLILFRAVGVTFQGIGDKVSASYHPDFNPDPNIFFTPSMRSRLEFSRMITLKRLFIEYEIAAQTIKKENPTVLYIDGKVLPMASDFADMMNNSPLLAQAELDVKQKYRELIVLAKDMDTLLCGLVKDSRSRELSAQLSKSIPEWIRKNIVNPDDVRGWSKVLPNSLDHILTANLLEKHERTVWLESQAPEWLPSALKAKIWSCMVRPIAEDSPIRVEIVVTNNDVNQKAIDIALGGLSILTEHGLPIAIPTIIMEADDRTKLHQDVLDSVTNHIALKLGIPVDKLKRRRNFRTSEL